MIYELKKRDDDDCIITDNIDFYSYHSTFINTQNIYSIEQYKNADNDIYGIRINGVKHPILNLDDLESEMVCEQEGDKFHKYLYYSKNKIDYSELSESEKKEYNEFDKLRSEKWDEGFDYLDKIFNEIIEIMKKEAG